MSRKGNALFVVHDLYQDDNFFPLGIGYLAAVLRNAGHNVTIYSQDVYHYTNEELARFLDQNEFDMIGIGFLAARYEETIRPLAKVIYDHKKCAKIILGGQGASAIPEYVLQDTQADIAALGESEKVIVPLLENIVSRRDISNMPGFAVRNGKSVKINPKIEPQKNLDSLPFPAWDLFPIEEYITCIYPVGGNPNDRFISVIASRGCVNDCSFCYRMERGIRVRSLQNIYEELKILTTQYGTTYVEFEDEMFLPSKQRIRGFAAMLKKLDHPIKYNCQARVELGKDKEILKMLKETGCVFLNYGFESMDQRVLDLMGKRAKVEENEIAARNTIGAGIHPGLNFIWGNPGDTKDSLKRIVDFLLKYDTLGHLRTIRPPTPFPGCPLYFQAIRERKLKGPADFFEKFKNSDRLTVNFTEISDEDVYHALLEANSILIKNYFSKKGEPASKSEAMINDFKKVYFPKNIDDMRFRGARHYTKKKPAVSSN